MRKIFFSFIICLMMMLCFSSVISAVGMPQIIASNEESAPGEIVDITIALKDNPGIVSMTLTVTFDDSVMSLIEVNDENLLPGQMHTTKKNSPYTLTWENDTSKTDFFVDGVIVTLRFKIAATARSGDYPIVIGYPIDGIYNCDVENIDFVLNHGNVKITKELSGNNLPQSQEHIHDMIYIPGQDANCQGEGQLEYWFCQVCQKKYRDEEGTVVINDIKIAIDPTNHMGKTVYKNKLTATKTTDGYTGDLYCLECGRLILSGVIIPATGGAIPEQSSITHKNDVEWKNPFIDVSENDSYYQAVRYVYLNGLFKGVSDNLFAPETTMTRGMFVTVLGRLAGIDNTYYNANNSEYSDVIPGEWYAPYVEWATKNGIVKGYGDGRFGVYDTITIEQAAVLMYRYAGYVGISQRTDIELVYYNDEENISEWAKDSVKWVLQNKVYKTFDHYIHPKKHAKRSVVAEIVYAFVTNFE